MTESVGVYRTTFYSNWFGGKEWIVARSPQIVQRDSVLMTMQVPGLELLPVGTNYSKIGGTCSHHGPGGVGNCGTPDNNHWAHSSVVVWLDSLAHKYKREFNPASNIKYNDISLPYGGLFDHQATCNAPHQLHRLGKERRCEG
jgi:hypothetical protein